MNGLYWFGVHLMGWLFPLWFQIREEGKENLPQTSGYLFISNHRSMADPILIAIQNQSRPFCFLAKKELFRNRLLGWLFCKLGAVPVERGSGDLSVLDDLKNRLKNGGQVLIFPEGTRSKTGQLGRFKTGAALIAVQTGVPVIPVGIFFTGRLHFRSRIVVRYGTPLSVPVAEDDEVKPALLKKMKQEMVAAIEKLL